MMKHVNNCLVEDINGKFDKVIWVTVSKTPNLVNLQDDIAQQLGLDLSTYKNMTIRVAKLNHALQERRRYVLILDDMWVGIPLPEIGIPKPTVENECKLVLTTRTLDVCNFMNTAESIPIGFLSEEEALDLFLDHVGRDILLVNGLKPIVEAVSRRCACLPLAIVVVARSMAGKKQKHEWTTACRKLRSKSKYPDDKAKEVIDQLIFSYERLKSRELQLCLLYCALYPEDHEISVQEMIEVFINVGIIEDVQTRQDQLDEGHDMFTTLKNVCFIEDAGIDFLGNKVKMHDLVRDMALQIAGDRFIVEAGLRLEELPNEKKWSKNLMEASLMKNDIIEFPSNVSSECAELSVLLLQENPFKVIPNSFFKHMVELKVLNLSLTSIENLPSSVSNLVNLDASILRMCNKLRHVPSLAMIKNLRRLDLAHSKKLNELPHGLEKLTNLKYLDLTRVGLEIPHGLLPKLSQLQYLVTGEIMIYDSLKSLKKLECFHGYLADINCFNELFNHRNLGGGLVDYCIRVGIECHWEAEHSRRVSLGNCKISKSGDRDELLMLPKDIEVLEIESNSSISSLCDVPSLNNVTHLRECWIRSCQKIEVLISSPSSIMLPLQTLELLEILYMSNLRELIGRETIELRALPSSTFSCLKEFEINHCSQMEELFPVGLMPYLQSLEQIEVSDCKNLVNIIGGTSSTSNITLPKLWNLRLAVLPELKSICPSPNLMVCNSLEMIYVLRTPSLKRIPISLPLDNQGQLCPPPLLREIKMRAQDWETTEWVHSSDKTILKRFYDSRYM